MIPTVPRTKEPVLVEKHRQQERRIAIMHLLVVQPGGQFGGCGVGLAILAAQLE